MEKCPKCNASMYPEDLFCGFCGCNLVVHHKKIGVTQQELKVSDVRFNLGVVYMKKNEFAKAIDIFSKILMEEPDNQKVIEMLVAARGKEKQLV
jgi:Tfp pilus assembly protein PilF